MGPSRLRAEPGALPAARPKAPVPPRGLSPQARGRLAGANVSLARSRKLLGGMTRRARANKAWMVLIIVARPPPPKKARHAGARHVVRRRPARPSSGAHRGAAPRTAERWRRRPR